MSVTQLVSGTEYRNQKERPIYLQVYLNGGTAVLSAKMDVDDKVATDFSEVQAFSTDGLFEFYLPPAFKYKVTLTGSAEVWQTVKY